MSPTVPAPESPLSPTSPEVGARYRAPAFEVIALDCEITAYAPEGDDPLF